MEKIVFLLIIVFVISANVTNAQEYIPGYNFKEVRTILQNKAKFKFDGKEKWENSTTYYFKKAQGLNDFLVDVNTKENGKILEITAQIHNNSSNEKISKSFLQLVGTFLSGGASKKYTEELSPWIIKHYKKGGETTFRGVRVILNTSGQSWQMLTLAAQ